MGSKDRHPPEREGVARLKLAFIIDNPRVIGGGDYALFKYAEQLAVRGHHVDVYGQYYNEFMDHIVRSDSFRLHLRGGFPAGLKGAGRFNRIWDAIHERLVLRRRFSRAGDRPDVIIGYHRRSAIRAAAIGTALGIPVANVVFESPAWLEKVFGEKYVRGQSPETRRDWERVREAYRASRMLFPLAEVVRGEVAEWIGRPVGPPIYCGVNDPGPPPDGSSGGEYALYIGRLDINKNVHEIIDAVAGMTSPIPLVIAGGGYEEPDLRRRAADRGINCTFRGHITDEEKWRLIRDCAFMVFPSSFEGFGIPPAEALVCERPCICSDIPILREVYGDMVETVREHHVDDLAAMMDRLWADPVYRAERGRKGRAFILDRYTWARAAERMEQGLLEAVGGQHTTINIEHPTSNIQHPTSNIQCTTLKPEPLPPCTRHRETHSIMIIPPVA